MFKTSKFTLSKSVLAVSGCSFLFLSAPAWSSGIIFACIASALLCILIWKLSITQDLIQTLFCKGGMLPLGLVVSSAYGCNFYNQWSSSYILNSICETLGISSWVIAVPGATIGVLISVPAVTCALAFFISIGWDDYSSSVVSSRISTPAKNFYPQKLHSGFFFLCTSLHSAQF